MSTGAEDRGLRTPEELIEIGLGRSRVVIVNEAHNGWLRCVRTREIGRRILPTAHRMGVRHLAMEALWSAELIEEANRSRVLPRVPDGYLAQPEMRELIQAALDLEWILIGYEAGLHQEAPDLDPIGMAFTNWREERQASNLTGALASLPWDARLLVWCGNHHQLKAPVAGFEWGTQWRPMGWHLVQRGIDPFVIDQCVSVEFMPPREEVVRALDELAPALEQMGGTAGFLSQEAPPSWDQPGVDAVLVSLHNRLE